MEEIWALQAEFERAQEAEIVQRLSERNCVEIVLKLIESGRIKLIFSSTGKEFLTPGRLKVEILNEIRSHGGRISITDLPDLLNVDLVNIERISNEIAATSSALLVNGQLISKSYIDSICSEIAETVLETGMITLSALSQQFALPIGLLQNELDLRLQSLGQRFSCQLNLQNQRLYTDLFTTTNNAKIRGLLLGCTRPISLQVLISQHGLQEKFIKGLIQDMQIALPGTISGGSNTLGLFTPWVYTLAQKEHIMFIYNQNNYIELNALNNAEVSMLTEIFPEGILLLRIFINPVLLQAVQTALLETISSETWLDARKILPSSLSSDDIASIIKKAEESPVLKKASKQYHHIDKVFVVSNVFVKSCSVSLETFIVQLGTEAAITMHNKNSQQLPVVEDSDPKGSKTKKDRSKKRSLNIGSLSRHIRPSLDLGSVQNSLETLCPDCDRALLSGIVTLLAPSFRIQFEKVRDSPHIIGDRNDNSVDLTELRRKQIKHWIQHIQSLSESFQVFSAANKELKGVIDDVSQLELYLIQSVGRELSDGLLRLNVYLNNTSYTDDDESSLLDEDRRNKLTAMLPSGDAHLIISLSSLGSSSEFFAQFQGLAVKCDVKIKDVPKKKLKQLSFTLKARLAQQVANEQRPEAILLSALLLLLYRSIGMILHAPYSCVNFLLDTLEKTKISKEALDHVTSLKTEIENPSGDAITTCISNVRSLLILFADEILP